MKRLTLSLTLCSLLTVAGAAAQDVCSFSGVLPDNSYDGSTAYIINADTHEKIDSTVIKDKAFAFQTEVKATLPVVLAINNDSALNFILEPGTLTMQNDGSVTGAPLNNLNEEIAATVEGYIQEHSKAVQALQTSGAPKEEITAEAERLNEATTAKFKKYLTQAYSDNRDNVLSYSILKMMYGMLDLSKPELDAMVAEACDFTKNSRVVGELMEMAEKMERTSAGKMFTDFSVTMSNGKTVKLSDYVGKGDYVLLDFFASWCGPCMREMPTIKRIYEKYKGKGLTVVGLAVWDKPADTKACVEQKALPWTIIDNAQKEPAEIYGVTGIPHLILFGPDGKIVFRGLRGAKLEAEIDKLMAK